MSKPIDLKPSMKNSKLASVIGLKKPVDGFTPEERTIQTSLIKLSITGIYNKLPTFRMRLIVALHFELGYPQEIVAEIVGIKQPSLLDELKLIKQVLSGKAYKPRKKPHFVDKDAVIRMIAILQEKEEATYNLGSN